MKYLIIPLVFLMGCSTASKGCYIEATEASFSGYKKITIIDPKGAPGICVDRAFDLVFDKDNNYKVKFSYEDDRK